jgi:glycosyltransferase involved in cell wall biosynthesis
MTAALRRQGVEASILTTDDDGPGRLADLPLGRWHERNGVPVLAFPRWSPPLAPLREFAVAPGLTRWLLRNLRNYHLLHVHALFSWPSTSGMVVARLLGVPYVLRTIGQLNEWSLQRSAGRKRLLLRLIERANLQEAAALHFTSEAEWREADTLKLSSPSFVLPLGVETPPDLCEAVAVSAQAGASTSEPRPTRYLFLSRLHPKKQLPLLLEALALLRGRNPAATWKLAVAGSGEPAYEAELRERARQLGLAERIEWLGFVQGETKWQELCRADWFVLPSASENFGIAAAEALTAGTPVILSPGVAIAEAVAAAGAGRISNPRPEALARTLSECLLPPSVQLREQARHFAADTYGWEPIVRQLREHYAAILDLQGSRH